MSELPPDLIQQLRDFIDREVRGGFTPAGDIPQAAVDYLADEADAGLLRARAEQYAAEALLALAAEQKAWPTVTDCDRLDAAFATLEASGIVARQDFSCCQNCGHAEMWEEVQAAVAAGKAPLGYTFYHQQDTESAVEGHGLCLAYGATEPGDDELAKVGHQVVAAVRAQGLNVTWDGDPSKRISVSIEWRRRRD